MRNKEGKHIIPVPTFELKRQFSGYFTDPITLFFKRKGQTIAEEKTIMRPSYSYLGEYKISQKVIADICAYEISRFDSIYKLNKMKIITAANGFLTIDIDVTVNFPCRVSKQMELAAGQVKESVENHTGIAIRRVSVNPKDLHMGD